MMLRILSDMIDRFRIAFDFRGEVSPRSLTDWCVFDGFFVVNLNDVCSGRPPLLTPASPQMQVKRALPAMAAMRLFEADDKAAELRQ